MKGKFKYYLIAWAALFVLFNLIVFITPSKYGEISRFTGSFLIGYVFTVIFFFAHLACAWFALHTDKEKVFLNFPLISISLTGLIVMAIIGVVCMTVPFIPAWISIIVASITFVICLISVLSAKAAGEMVGDIDKKIKEETFFIKSLTIDAESLLNRIDNTEIKAEAKKVYEAVRYSDPMSNEKLAMEESRISSKFTEFSATASTGNIDEVKRISAELTGLIEDRNRKCKLFK